MNDEYYRFAAIDTLLDLLQKEGVIGHWSNGIMDEEDEYGEALPGDFGLNENPDWCSFDLPGGEQDEPLVTVHDLPKRLFLRLFDVPKEDLPRLLLLLPHAVEADTWEQEPCLDKFVKALIRRAVSSIPLWAHEKSHRDAFLKVLMTVLSLRLVR